MNRTFPDNVQFRKTAEPCLQQTLYNVLVAYGHHNKTVGYCQVCNLLQIFKKTFQDLSNILVVANFKVHFWEIGKVEGGEAKHSQINNC